MTLVAHEIGAMDQFAAYLNRGFSILFRHWIAAASIWALVTVAGAVLTPWLASLGFETAAQILYWAYRPLCPQRPDHSFFIAGHKMAFEQRETAMFIAGALASPLYMLVKRTSARVPGWLVIAATVPMLADVASQSVALHEGDWFVRSVTGALAVLFFALWAYPKLDADLTRSMTGHSMMTAE